MLQNQEVISALSPGVCMSGPNPQGYKPGPFSLSSPSSPPSSLPPPKATALTSGCNPSWWHCQGHSDEFQAGRSTSWGARTRPRGPTAVLGGSYNQPHSCPAPHSLLAPRSFDHMLGHTPGTPGPQDTGQLGTETHAGQGHNCCCSAHPSGIHTPYASERRQTQQSAKVRGPPGDLPSLRSFWSPLGHS